MFGHCVCVTHAGWAKVERILTNAHQRRAVLVLLSAAVHVTFDSDFEEHRVARTPAVAFVLRDGDHALFIRVLRFLL